MALHNSIVAALLIFGWPVDDHCSSCLAQDKWEPDAVPVVLFLGFYIDSQALCVTWPLYKCRELHDEIMAPLQQ
jgi:hypothetical protein